MGKSNNQRRADFAQALVDLNTAYKRAAAAAANLPKMPRTITGDVVEVGIDRTERGLDYEDGQWGCGTHGYDAYSEAGEFSYVDGDDGKWYAQPEDINWD